MKKEVWFTVESVTPDPRAYNQQRQLYKPVYAIVGVSIEVNPENFTNVSDWYEKHLLWELGGEGEKPTEPDEDKLIFSSLGWSRVMEKLEEPYNSPMESSIDVQSAFEGEPTDF